MRASGSVRGAALIVGVYEHPGRKLPDHSLAQIHAEVSVGALADAGLELSDVDAYFCAGDTPGVGPLSMADYLGLRTAYHDSTEVGGASYLSHVGHAAAAIAAGRCSVALITLGGKPRTGGAAPGVSNSRAPDYPFEQRFGLSVPAGYAMFTRRRMHEYGTTSEDLALVKVAASVHASYNPNAMLPKRVTVREVLDSPMVADPLHRLDCCVISDGGGALVLTSPEIAKSLGARGARLLGHAETIRGTSNGRIDLTSTGAEVTGPKAFKEAGITPADVDYAGIYDSFTITLLAALEDLGFCERGKGGAFLRDHGIIGPDGALPVNTDGGGLCNNHPGNRGGMTKIIEAVRQLRGEAHPELQVPDCRLAVAHGTGGSLGLKAGVATIVLEAQDA
jgi:acetyl-CoA C-acetyltransferase